MLLIFKQNAPAVPYDYCNPKTQRAAFGFRIDKGCSKYNLGTASDYINSVDALNSSVILREDNNTTLPQKGKSLQIKCRLRILWASIEQEAQDPSSRKNV